MIHSSLVQSGRRTSRTWLLELPALFDVHDAGDGGDQKVSVSGAVADVAAPIATACAVAAAETTTTYCQRNDELLTTGSGAPLSGQLPLGMTLKKAKRQGQLEAGSDCEG